MKNLIKTMLGKVVVDIEREPDKKTEIIEFYSNEIFAQFQLSIDEIAEESEEELLQMQEQKI